MFTILDASWRFSFGFSKEWILQENYQHNIPAQIALRETLIKGGKAWKRVQNIESNYFLDSDLLPIESKRIFY